MVGTHAAGEWLRWLSGVFGFNSRKYAMLWRVTMLLGSFGTRSAVRDTCSVGCIRFSSLLRLLILVLCAWLWRRGMVGMCDGWLTCSACVAAVAEWGARF